MAKKPPKASGSIEELDAKVADRRAAYLAAYDREKNKGLAVVMPQGSVLKRLWDELTAAREERNALLDLYRSSGVQL